MLLILWGDTDAEHSQKDECIVSELYPNAVSLPITRCVVLKVRWQRIANVSLYWFVATELWSEEMQLKLRIAQTALSAIDTHGIVNASSTQLSLSLGKDCFLPMNLNM